MKKILFALIIIIVWYPIASGAAEEAPSAPGEAAQEQGEETKLEEKLPKATCGDAKLELSEACEGDQICKQGEAGGCENPYYVCHPEQYSLSDACNCFRYFCGDGCINKDEECDPRATEVSGKIEALKAVENNGCLAGKSCSLTCTCVAAEAKEPSATEAEAKEPEVKPETTVKKVVVEEKSEKGTRKIVEPK